MKKIIKYLAIASFSVALGVVVYSFIVVRNAEEYTKRTILPDLRASQWRPLQGETIPFEILKSELPPSHIKVLLKVQDPGFYSHHGIDLSTPGAGLTTITQAIVKKLYFNKFKSGFRKFKQSVIAKFVVDKMITKEEQITIFINSMYYGRINNSPQIGLQAAAKGYFNKDAKSLSKDEFVSIIATIVAPNTFNPIDHPEWNKIRSDRIQRLDSGEYVPKGLMDQFYGILPQEIVDAGLPLCSYFPSLYKDE